MATCGKITSGADFVFLWKIDNFLKRPEANDQPFNSPLFSIIDNNGRIGAICLQIYSKGDTRTSKHVSLFIINKTKEDMELSSRWGPYLNY